MTNQEYLTSVYSTGFSVWDANKRVLAPLFPILNNFRVLCKIDPTKVVKDEQATIAKFITLLNQEHSHTFEADVLKTLVTLKEIVELRA